MHRSGGKRAKAISAIMVTLFLMASGTYYLHILAKVSSPPLNTGNSIAEMNDTVAYSWYGNFSNSSPVNVLHGLLSNASLNAGGKEIWFLNASLYGTGGFAFINGYDSFEFFLTVNGTVFPGTLPTFLVILQNTTLPGTPGQSVNGMWNPEPYNYSDRNLSLYDIGSFAYYYKGTRNVPALQINVSWLTINEQALPGRPYQFSLKVPFAVQESGISHGFPSAMNFTAILKGGNSIIAANMHLLIMDNPGIR